MRTNRVFYKTQVCMSKQKNILSKSVTTSIPKHGFCMWMACHNRLPTQDRIILWKQEPPDMKCVLCEQVVDSHRHLFFTCPFSVTIWRQIKREVDLYGFYEDWDAIVDALDSGRGPKLLIQKLAL